MRYRILTLFPAVLLATAASASSPAAWNQMNQRVNRACVAMSGLARPELIAAQISFSDAIGTEVRMLRGMQGRQVKRVLCAYNRRTGRAEVQDAPAWTANTMKP
jgi:hypothetical protein